MELATAMVAIWIWFFLTLSHLGRGAPVDATGHGLWSEDDGYDGDGEGAEDGEEMQVEEVEVPSNATPETPLEPEELPEPLASCIREDGSAPAVHAAFYLWYGNPETDGRWLHWDHKVLPHWDPKVDAQHEKFDWRPPDEPHSTFFPARGTYSSADNATLRAQFRELRQAGVDSAMCSWWGRKDWNGKRDDAESGANTDLLMPLVLEAAAAAEVFVSFHIEPYGNRSAKTFLEDLKYIFREYGDHPAIYREGKDKRPIFWLYDVSAQHSASEVAEWRAVLDSVRGTALDGVFLCLWIGNGGGREDLRFVQEGGFDGAYTYFAAEGFTPGSNTKSWADVAGRLRKIGKVFVPSVGPGYDDTRIRPWNKHNVRQRKDGKSYERMWQAAVNSRPHAISVTSYNEWGEGTQIEPAKKHRSQKGEFYPSYSPHGNTYYLKLTRDWSKNFKEDQCGQKSEL